MEDVTDTDYTRTESVCKELEKKNISKNIVICMFKPIYYC